MGLFRALAVAILAVVVYYIVFGGKTQYKADDVKGLRVVVTGASSGIGEQIAYKFASMGAKLMITARTEAKLQKVVKKCLELGAAEAYHVSASQYSYENASRVITAALEILGGIDILVLNHIGQTYFGNYKYDARHIEKLMMANMLTHAHMSDLAMPSLKKRNGRIAVISSGAAFLGGFFLVPYGTTKSALNGFFTSLRHELLFNDTSVSITLCHLGLVNTKSAQRVIQHTQFVVNTKNDAAAEIVRGTMARESNLYFPWYWFIVRMMIVIAPDLTGTMSQSIFRVPDNGSFGLF